MSIIIDEQLATLLLQHCMADVREGWAGWGQLALVNRACARVFRLHASQLVNFCFTYMHMLVQEKNRQLHLWAVNCECAAFERDSDDESDADGDEVHFEDGAISPATSVEY
jgi:hypothetical protein